MNGAKHKPVPDYATDIVARLLEVVQALDVCEQRSKVKDEVFVPVTKGSARILSEVFKKAKEAEFLGNASELVGASEAAGDTFRVYPVWDESLRNVHTIDDSHTDVIQQVKGQLESLLRQPDLELIHKLIPANQARAYGQHVMVDYSRMPVDAHYVFNSVMNDIRVAIKPMKSHAEMLDEHVEGAIVCVEDNSASEQQSVKVPMPDRETASAVKWFLEECRNKLGSTTFRESFSVDNKADHITIRAKGTSTLSDVMQVLDDVDERTLTQGLRSINSEQMQKRFAKTVYNMPESAAEIMVGQGVAG